ncbi:MAG: hypothetical protein PHY86_03740, partial [Candidatus Gracilibacteria bacterium]|nr:hypothetical protein [Candidatus Gracilibacteria bacterium]
MSKRIEKLRKGFPFILPLVKGVVSRSETEGFSILNFLQSFPKSPLTPLYERGEFLDSRFRGNDKDRSANKKIKALFLILYSSILTFSLPP